jgi:hypothetical protein
LLVIILAAAASTASAKSADLSALLAAIRQVESAGNDRAVGDGGKSRGPFQIQRAYWREAVAGTDAAGWDYDKHVWDPERAGYVVWLHWSRVCPAALRGGDVEQLARRHRLPNAPWQADNAVYWRKVHVILTLKERLRWSRTETHQPGPAYRLAAYGAPDAAAGCTTPAK